MKLEAGWQSSGPTVKQSQQSSQQSQQSSQQSQQSSQQSQQSSQPFNLYTDLGGDIHALVAEDEWQNSFSQTP